MLNLENILLFNKESLGGFILPKKDEFYNVPADAKGDVNIFYPQYCTCWLLNVLSIWETKGPITVCSSRLLRLIKLTAAWNILYESSLNKIILS